MVLSNYHRPHPKGVARLHPLYAPKTTPDAYLMVMHWHDEYCSHPEQGAYSPYAPVRALAARPQPLPLRTQMRLAHDPIPAVRQALAAHDPLPAAIIDELSWDPNPRVLATLAEHHALTGEQHTRLLQCLDPAVCRVLGHADMAAVLEQYTAGWQPDRPGKHRGRP